jgi:nitroreductase/FMN reductase [NAD(P)H]
LQTEICSLLAGGTLGQKWLANVPNLLIFCGNNRRQRQIHALRGKPFANDHFDAVFNATVDAAIVMSAFIIVAEAEGLGVCPISAVRNHADAVSKLLKLPDHVFPVAGLAAGYPAESPRQNMRLPLSVTVHHNQFDDAGVESAIDIYDRRREAAQAYERQRSVERFGLAEVFHTTLLIGAFVGGALQEAQASPLHLQPPQSSYTLSIPCGLLPSLWPPAH